ncbi:MAG: FAD-dependent oxidoreductase [Thermoanaerobacteraceae bacterium]|nr:FAD-dependent oxidoreductase [Thermoanaerobacteraceae bacterium]
MESYLVIGNGIAGLNAAEAIRDRDKDGRVTIISEEKYNTYSRLMLSHYLGKDVEPEKLYIHPVSWYEERNIEIYLNTKVEKVDTEKKVVKTTSGEFPYTKLIIASGSYSFIPPVEGSNKGNVFALRSLDDMKAITNAIKSSKKAIVIGGGVLGLEAVWAIRQAGLEVDVLEFFPRLLPRQMDEEGSKILKDIVEGTGVTTYLGVETKAILGEDRAEGVILKGGQEIKADFVVFSSGVRPHIEFLNGQPIEIKRGIVVDEYMRTSLDGVYAAGDVAEFKGAMPAIWPVAQEQGKIAGMNAAGEEATYHPIPPSNMLKVMNVSCFSVGEINNEKGELKELKYTGNKEYYKLFLRNNVLVGAMMIGDVSKSTKIKSYVDQKKDISEFLISDNAKEIISSL